MSKPEQEALLAFFNTFRLTRRVNVFASLADGKALMEVMSQIDGTHFKASPARAGAGGAGPSENWVLKMNSLKRLYRLLLSYPLPAPQPSLSLTSLSEPNFSAVARSPTSPDGLAGLVQICRFCLSIGVWANENEKVVRKIQNMDEKIMAELMRCIEEVMATLPEPEEDQASGNDLARTLSGSAPSSKRSSPVKPSPAETPSPPGPAPGGIRAERDKLIRDNDELRDQCAKMKDELVDLTTTLDTVKQEREDALARLSAAREASATGLRTSQSATSEIDRLRADLAHAEENVHRVEADLAQKTTAMQNLIMEVDELRPRAEEAAKLRDQLDEHRHVAERLQKSENVIEKYRKKLDESATLRRDYKRLEEENSQMRDRLSAAEQQQRKSGASKEVVDGYQKQLADLAKRSSDQATEVERLEKEADSLRAQLESAELAHEKDKEELQELRDRAKEVELAGLKRVTSADSVTAPARTLDAELDSAADEHGETAASLRRKVELLERELASLRLSSTEDQPDVSALNGLLADAIKARDGYQNDYLAANRERTRLQYQLNRSQTIVARDDAHTRERSKEQDYSDLRSELLQQGITDNSLKFLWSVFEHDPELAGRLRIPRPSTEADLQFEQLARALNQQETGITQEALDYLAELHSWNTEIEGRLREARLTNEPKPSESTDDDSGEHAAQITALQTELKAAKHKLEAAEKELGLMLSAWHDLGMRTAKEHMTVSVNTVKRSGAARPMPMGWLGRQRRYQEDAIYLRT